MIRPTYLIASSVFALMAVSAQAQTETAPASQPAAAEEQGAVGEIIVTAQKRAQAITDVPITIAVASGEQLAQRGIVETADLGKVVSGFVYVPAPFGQPVYVLRGVGLYDSGLGSAPTVSVYVDQVALPFSLMTQGAALDLERVEVLKGPQGTLFGTNNTGGAINYVAAKPTNDFQLGGSATYERFNKATVKGYVSGPLSDTVKARLALQGVSGGAWQKSLTRDDELGDSRQIMGRLLVDIEPSDSLKISLNANGFRDRSDTQASQLREIIPSSPATAYPEFLASPLAKRNARSADWDPLASNRKNEKFYQLSARVDYDLADQLSLTSVTAYSDLKSDRYTDIDGSAVVNSAFQTFGRLKDFNQELRLQLATDRLIALAGANYQHSNTKDNNQNYIDQLSINVLPTGVFTRSSSYAYQTVDYYALFANAEYKLTDQLTFQAGGRYTWARRDSESCAVDNTPGAPLKAFFQILQGVFAPGVPQEESRCYQLNVDQNFASVPYLQELNEENFSYRAALNYKFEGGTLVFGSISRGYKGGVISNVGPSISTQFLPAKQERLDAYEIGIKAPLLDRRAFLNVSAFYYDYTDKQIRERINDAIFGNLELLVTVPKARIWGIDADFNVRPVNGLTLTASGTYLNSKITDDFESFNGAPVIDQSQQSGNFKGSPLSYTPKFTGNLDAQYDWDLNENFGATVGASLSYHSKDNAGLKPQGGSLSPKFNIPAYTLIDLRAGIHAADDQWRLEVFGRNITNKYYITTVFQPTDERHVYAGMPATYGVTVGFKY